MAREALSREGFSENLSVGLGEKPAKHTPSPGSATIEIRSADGSTLALDTIDLDRSPPPHGLFNSTLVIPAKTQIRQHEYTVPVDRLPTLIGQDIPDHLDKVNASIAKVWWTHK